MNKVKPAIFNIDDYAFKEVRYKISLELEVVEHTDTNGTCPLTVVNALKLFLHQYKDSVEVLDMKLTPNIGGTDGTKNEN